jgi:predicted ATPase
MITRLYANNFRCRVGFEAKFDSFGVLCGPNGAGKSSVFDAIMLIRNLATGDGILGGKGDRDVEHLEFTNWPKGSAQESTIQELELGVTAEGHAFEYTIHLEQKASFEKPRFVKERATYDGKSLFDRDLEGVRFQRADGTQAGFPLDGRQAALASMEPRGEPARNRDSPGSHREALDSAARSTGHGIGKPGRVETC